MQMPGRDSRGAIESLQVRALLNTQAVKAGLCAETEEFLNEAGLFTLTHIEPPESEPPGVDLHLSINDVTREFEWRCPNPEKLAWNPYLATPEDYIQLATEHFASKGIALGMGSDRKVLGLAFNGHMIEFDIERDCSVKHTVYVVYVPN